jgi:hypothetical protein
MAHFAEIDENNIVQRVIVVSDNDCGGGIFPQSEQIGRTFCMNLLGGYWLQTSYNGNFRVRYAGVGYEYSEQYDAFIPPKPTEEAVFNEDTLGWDIPQIENEEEL